MNRRDFLKALGIGTAALAIEPARKMWFVPSTAPVGSRVERLEGPGVWSPVGDGFDYSGWDEVPVVHGGSRIPGKSFISEVDPVSKRITITRITAADGPFAKATEQKLQNAAEMARMHLGLKPYDPHDASTYANSPLFRDNPELHRMWVERSRDDFGKIGVMSREKMVAAVKRLYPKGALWTKLAGA